MSEPVKRHRYTITVVVVDEITTIEPGRNPTYDLSKVTNVEEREVINLKVAADNVNTAIDKVNKALEIEREIA